jgi:succinate dehydrogenase/fumarate reductase cytochrome b subunit
LPPLTVAKHTASIVGFAIQVIVGAIAFVVVFLVAVAIAAIIHYFEGIMELPKWLSHSAKLVEMVIWGVDLFVFALFLLTELIKAIRTFLTDLKEVR